MLDSRNKKIIKNQTNDQKEENQDQKKFTNKKWYEGKNSCTTYSSTIFVLSLVSVMEVRNPQLKQI